MWTRVLLSFGIVLAFIVQPLQFAHAEAENVQAQDFVHGDFTPDAIPCSPLGTVSPMSGDIGHEQLCGGHSRLYLAGLLVSNHAARRMAERGISRSQVVSAVTRGKKYRSNHHDSIVYHRKRVNVAVSGKTITTVFGGSPSGTLIPIMW